MANGTFFGLQATKQHCRVHWGSPTYHFRFDFLRGIVSSFHGRVGTNFFIGSKRRIILPPNLLESRISVIVDTTWICTTAHSPPATLEALPTSFDSITHIT